MEEFFQLYFSVQLNIFMTLILVITIANKSDIVLALSTDKLNIFIINKNIAEKILPSVKANFV